MTFLQLQNGSNTDDGIVFCTLLFPILDYYPVQFSNVHNKGYTDAKLKYFEMKNNILRNENKILK